MSDISPHLLPSTRLSGQNQISGSLTTSRLSAPAQDSSLHPVLPFMLPSHVTLLLQGDTNQASAVAVTTALFASVLASLAQIGTSTPLSGASAEALWFFIYSAILANILAAAFSFIIIKLCADLPYIALQSRSSSLSKLEDNNQPTNRYELLMKYGMTKKYRTANIWAGIFTFSGMFLSLVAISLWVWLTQSQRVAGAAMVFTGSGTLALIYMSL